MPFDTDDRRPDPATDRAAGWSRAHVAYVAGRYRDGSWSDGWTDVRRCAEATFTAYACACACGWRGARWFRPDGDGHVACLRVWVHEHARAAYGMTQQARAGLAAGR